MSDEDPLGSNGIQTISGKKMPAMMEEVEIHAVDDSADDELDHEFENEANQERESSEVTIAVKSVEAEAELARRRRSSKLQMRKPSLSSRPLRRCLASEVLPHADHYRNRLSFYKGKPDRTRPTLDELLEERTSTKRNERNESHRDDPNEGKAIKFGWIDGVYMRCLLNIWGVTLFLRLTWVIGQSGLIEGLSIITLSTVVTLITAMSMSAVSTNGQIKAGGIYYMISRSLGPEFGGAIGLMFTMANSIAVAMYLIGFCESLIDMMVQLLPDFNGIVDSTHRVNDIRLIGSVSLVLILGLAIVGMDWVTRVQMGLLFLLVIAQIDFVIGTFLPPSDEAKAKGFVGYNGTVFESNLWSQYTADEKGKMNTFFSVFAVFFPAVTGIGAGANFSGDLKNPGSAIPKGTLLAIATTYTSYVILGIMSAGCTLRFASGVEAEVHYGTDIFNETVGKALNISHAFDDCKHRDCQYGSSMSQQMMEVISAWGPLIYAGCFAATLSSAIASLVGAPRVFQAVAKDKLFPFIGSFAEGWGANNDPVRGYILVFIISLVCILIGDLNMVSSLLSNFFVASYALVNFSVFHASITNSPGWRPSFKYYNKWISLFGTILCIVVMFLMDYMTALVTFIFIIALYMYVHIRNPDVNWGSSSQSQSFISALKAVQTLTKVEDHVKNYRPKPIVMSGNPEDRPCLIDFANLLTKRLSLLACANIVDTNVDWKQMALMKAESTKWLAQNHIKAFFAVTRNHLFSEGVRTTIELTGLGKLSPNMLLIGFQQCWKQDQEKCEEYVKAIQVAFDLHLSVGVLRVEGGMNISNLFGRHNKTALSSIKRQRTNSELSDSSLSILSMEECMEAKISMDSGALETAKDSSSVIGEISKHIKVDQKSLMDKLKGKKSLAQSLSLPLTDPNGKAIEEDVIERVTQFRNKSLSKEGSTIDVYWLYDDGGLTLLLPHILSTRARFAKCRFRVFFLSNKIEDLDMETRNMATLLDKFRIACQDVILLPDVTTKPSRQIRDEFQEILTLDSDVILVSKEALEQNSEKTNFHLRITEIVRQNSGGAELIVMTLPLLQRNVIPPTLFMAWMEFMTKGLPPFLMLRGNQESVLTFYS